MILASNSPRRRELLNMLGFDFDVKAADCDESTNGLPAGQAVAVLSKRKALAVAADCPDEVVIGSDTLVTIDGSPLGKPKDADDARRMLALLSGRTHTVCTAVTIAARGATETFTVTSEVEFYPLDKEDIESYVATGEPLDKAGADGIQGRGAALIKRISGDYYAVMGLPIAELARRLKKYGIYPQKAVV